MKASRFTSAGFSITEMVAVVSILALAASMSLAIHLHLQRREQLNATAIGLAGWLEEVRRSALKGNPCVVTIAASGGAAAGTTMASAQERLDGLPALGTCQAKAPYTLSRKLGAFRVAVSPALTFTFGSLGTVHPIDDKQLVLSLVNPAGQIDLSRCIRLRGMLGFIEVGNRTGSTCTYPSRY